MAAAVSRSSGGGACASSGALRPVPGASALAGVALLLLGGCATTQISSEWRNPAFAGGFLHGHYVLVVCQARDESLRRICEDRLSRQLGNGGAAGIQSYSFPDFPPGGIAGPAETEAAVRSVGAVAVVSAQLVPSDFAVISPGPQVGFGVGGGSASGGYHGGGFSFGGFGLSFPVGGATATQPMSLSASLSDAASGVLVWSGSATAPAASDVAGQVSALARVIVDAWQRAGLLGTCGGSAGGSRGNTGDCR